MPDLAISVVIPARDAAATIGEQLAALSRQRIGEPWEVLVCDNGSGDDTAAVVAGWQERVPGLRLVDARTAANAGEARNLGVAAAASPLVAFCDADDVVADDWLAQVVSSLRDAALIGCLSELSSLNPHRGAEETSGPLYRWDSPPGLPFASSRAMAVHRDAFLAVGGFDPALRVGEDADLSWRLQLAGTAIAACPGAVVHVRHRDSLVGTIRQWFRYGRAQSQLAARFAQAGVPSAAATGSRADTIPAASSAGPAGGAWRRRMHRLGHLRDWRDLQPLLQRNARRLGLWWGARFGERLPPYDGSTAPARGSIGPGEGEATAG